MPPVDPPSPAPAGWPELVGLVRLLRRSLPLVLGFAAVTAAGAAVMAASGRPVYEAAALLTLGGDRSSSGFTPPVLSADGILRLLRSRTILAATKTALEAEGASPGASLDVEAELLASRRGELGNTSLLELTARAVSGEEAARIANTWAAVFTASELADVQRAALRDALDALQVEAIKSRDRHARAQDRVTSLARQLETIPATLTLKSRLTEAQWLAESSRTGAATPALGTVEGQQVNPLHTQVGAELRTAQAEADSLGPQVAELEASLAEARRLLARLDAGEVLEVDLGVLARTAPRLALPVVGTVQRVQAAVAPRQPQPRAVGSKAALAGVGGAILGFFAAALLELARGMPRSSRDPAPVP
ncbi:MAG TPA: hypothetical protein VF017_12090 [Thermoanaerobaculia bacterium]|nr:hypothetical protein [Thermoanaerobaculia bacterium]